MADYSSLIASIEAVIRQNGNNEITGPILQSVLKSMLSAINSTKADIVDIPTSLSQLLQTVNYRTVSDAEKVEWNAKTIATWGNVVNPGGNPAVGNRITLSIKAATEDEPISYVLALANHTHNVANLEGLTELLMQYVETDDLSFVSGTVGDGQVDVDSFYGIQLYDETRYFALKNHRHSYDDLLNKPAIPLLNERGDNGHPIYFDSANRTWRIDHLAIHPENPYPVILPFLFSDISFLLERGGQCNVSATGATWNDNDKWQLFDSSPSYFQFTKTGDATVTIEVIFPIPLYWDNYIYIDFGKPDWMAHVISVQWGHGSYTGGDSVSGLAVSFARFKVDASSTGFDRIKFVLTDWDYGMRISEIGVLNFNSSGLRATTMSRGVNDPVWRSITPATGDTYDLGASGKAWRNIWAQYLTVTEALYIRNIFSEGAFSLYTHKSNLLYKSMEWDGDNVYGRNLLPLQGSTYELGSSGSQWNNLYLAQALFFAGHYFLTQWSDDIVFNQYDGNTAPVKRLRYAAAIISDFAHIFQDNANTFLLTLGTENISYKDFRPDSTSRKLGTSSNPWGEVHGNKWYPVQGDTNTYVEWANGHFLFHGNVLVTGYLGSGEMGVATGEQSMYASLIPMLATLVLGSSDNRWAEGWFQTLCANTLGTPQKKGTTAHIGTAYIDVLSVNDTANWNVSDVLGAGVVSFSSLGTTEDEMNAIRSGNITKIYDDSEQKLYHVVEVNGTDVEATNTVIYFGRNLRLTQLSSSTLRIDEV